MTNVDFTTANYGSVITIEPVSAKAEEWIDENLAYEAWQAPGYAISIEPRYAMEIMEALLDEGFTLQDAFTGNIAEATHA